MKLSILIVNWNSKDFLRKCLLSIREHAAALNPQVIVADGASFDGCAEMLAREFPEVEFHQCSENVGFGAANNAALPLVRGKYLLLLNPDTELRENALGLLLSALDSQPKAGLAGPRILNTDGSLQTSCVMAFPTPANQALGSEFLQRAFPRSRLWARHAAFNSTSPIAVEAVSGACMLVRTELFRRVGGFSRAFYMYAEDLDLCWKLRICGFATLHVPAATVVHHGGGSSQKQFSKFSAVLTRQAIYTYMHLNHGRARALLYKVAMFASALVRLCALAPAHVPRCIASKSAAPSFLKWVAILRWSLGGENWAGKRYYNIPDNGMQDASKSLVGEQFVDAGKY